MEIIIAVAVMAILASAVGPMVYRQLQNAKAEATRRELEAIRSALEEYHDDTGTLPGDLAALVADDGRPGWTGPYLGSDWNDPVNQVNRDAFERAYTYVLNPTVVPAGSADLIVASAGINRSLDLPSGNTWNLGNISQVDDIVVHISASRLNRGKQEDTLAELEALAEAARNYYRAGSSFPGNLNLLAGSYLDTGFRNDSFTDEWNSPYRASISGSGQNARLRIWSPGPDRSNDNGGGDDLMLEINASAIEAGMNNQNNNNENEGTQSETTREVLTLQAALDANPNVNVGSSIDRRDLRRLGLSNDYQKDEWDKSYRVNRQRQIYSSGPDRDRRTTDDNIPQGVGG